MLDGVLISLSRLPLLFRGEAVRPSTLALLAVVLPPTLVLLAAKVRSGMRVTVAALWALLVIYALWAGGLLLGEPRALGQHPSAVWHWINLVPFATIGPQVAAASGSALVQLIGNVGLLLPLGLIGPIVAPSLRRASRLALVALGASVAIEVVQLLGTVARLIQRSVDVDDLILNVAGALLGWLLWRAMAGLRTLWEARMRVQRLRAGSPS